MDNQPIPGYRLRRLGRSHLSGVTQPLPGTLEAVIKFDSVEAPFCVYCEIVAVRLGRMLAIPVAEGVLTFTGTRQAFASIRLADDGSPRKLAKHQWIDVAGRYSQGVAALTAFDIFIGNGDRTDNFVASLVSHLPLLQGFDHSHALLCCCRTAQQSVRALRNGDLVVKSHPFYHLLQRELLERWVERIAAIPDHYVLECCSVGQPIGAVSCRMQASLGRALVVRKNQLRTIIDAHLGTIRPQ